MAKTPVEFKICQGTELKRLHEIGVTFLDPTMPAQAAYTLIEVMVGATVMVVIFASVFAILMVGLTITGTTRENLRATQIMLDKMEGLRLYTPTQLTNTTLLVESFTNWFNETGNIGMANVQGNGVQYNGSITIAPVGFSNSYSSNMSQVTVTVNWISGGSKSLAHTRSMSTFYASKGLANYVSTH